MLFPFVLVPKIIFKKCQIKSLFRVTFCAAILAISHTFCFAATFCAYVLLAGKHMNALYYQFAHTDIACIYSD